MKSLKITLLLFLTLAFTWFSPTISSLEKTECSSLEFIFARGSGQSMNDSDFKAYKEAIELKKGNNNVSFHELSRNYPAVAVGFNMALGAIVSAGNSYEFGESVEKGVSELVGYIRTESKNCPNKQFVLAGYSQGAVVIDKSLTKIDSNKVFYVANFGDPKLYLPEGKRACKNIGLSDYRVYVPDCSVEEGVLSGIKPYQPDGYKNKLGVWCNKSDFMCGSSLNLLNIMHGHTSYNSESGYRKFAELVFSLFENKTVQSSETVAKYSDSKKRDIAIVFDYAQLKNYAVRNNPKPIHDGLKNRLVQLAEQGTHVALYAYKNSLELQSDFSNDHLAQKIDTFNAKNVGVEGNYLITGIDNSYSAIKTISETANWQAGSERNIFIIVDTVPNGAVSADGTSVLDAIDAATKNKVKVSYVSQNGSEDYSQYRLIMERTEGASAKESQKIVLNINKTKAYPEYFSKTYQINQNSKYTLVVVNDTIYGLTTKSSITITELDKNRENIISFISYNESGEKIKSDIYYLEPKTIGVPNTGVI